MKYPRRSAAHTPVMRKVMRTLAQAQFLNEHPELENAMMELKDAGRTYRQNKISRRDFLKFAGQMGLVAGALMPARKISAQSNNVNQKVGSKTGSPVVILGAGFAGLTAAYNLMKAQIPCAVYEARPDHIGGRVWTVNNFNKDGMFIERGAELVDTNHEDLRSLCRELGIGEVQDIVTEDIKNGVESSVYYFNGQHYFEKDLLANVKEMMAQVDKDKKEAFPDDAEDWTEKAKAFDLISIEQYISGLPNAEPWVKKMLIQAYTNEFGLPASEQSAVNFINYIIPDISDGFKIFGESDEAFRIPGGNSTLAQALYKKLNEGRVPIYQGAECKQVKVGTTGQFDLNFVQNDGTNRTFNVSTDQVLCTIPFTVLRHNKILDTLDFTPEKKKAIAELGYGNSMKLMLGFTERYWKRKNLVSKNGTPILANNAAVVTDLKSQQFWETSRGQNGQSGILTNFMGGDWGRDYNKDSFATTKSDLDSLFPGITETIDYSAKRENWKWPIFKYTMGAYSCPKVGQVTTMIDAAGTEEYDGRFLFAGEHISVEFGGFMNGAIETGKKAAEKIIQKRTAKKDAKQGV